MIAVGMNGEPLTDIHGFPARLVTPGLYGFVGATKWLTRLTLTTYAAQQAYWTRRQWATDAPIKTSARIDTPAPLSTISPGGTVIGGVAWAQHRGVGRVEVQIDGGAWQAAQLGPDAGIDYWRQWYLPWDATTGQHTLRSALPTSPAPSRSTSGRLRSPTGRAASSRSSSSFRDENPMTSGQSNGHQASKTRCRTPQTSREAGTQHERTDQDRPPGHRFVALAAALAIGLAACGSTSTPPASGAAATVDDELGPDALLQHHDQQLGHDGPALRCRLLGGPEGRQGLVHRDGHRPGRHRREQQPGPVHSSPRSRPPVSSTR